MNKLCVIGIGGIGVSITEEVTNKLTCSDMSVSSIGIDTDKFNILQSNCTHNFDISYPSKMKDMLAYISDSGVSLFTEEELAKLGYILSLPMDKGANAWRYKAFATFVAYMCNEENKERFNKVLDNLFVDDSESVSIYVVSSLGGGTGSSLCVPISLYVKKYLAEKGINKVDFTYFAVCPDITSESTTLEMRTKAYANAYATLYEINQINNIILNKEKSSLKIGFEDEKSFGLLFDANSNKYLSKKYIPFDKIVLFDRMPGVSSVDFHINLFANYISYYYLGYTSTNNEKPYTDSAIFKSYNVIEFDYSLDNIIDYIAKYKTNEIIKNELIDFYTKIESYQPEFDNNVKNAKNSEIYNYANKINLFFENNVKEEKTSYALNREEQEHTLTPCVDDNSWLDKYLQDFLLETYELLKDENYNNFTSKLNISNYKKVKNSAFVNKVEELYNELTDYYFSSLEKTAKLQEKSLFLTTENNCLSLVNNVLKDGENFIHPTLAIIRLSQLYLATIKKINKKYFSKEENLIYDENKRLIPEEFLTLFNYERGSKGYGKLKEDRFKRIVAKVNKSVDINSLSRYERAKYLKELKKYTISSKYDKKFVLNDFNIILDNILSELKYIYLIKLSNVIENLINLYRKTIKDLVVNYYKIEKETIYSKKEKVSKFIYYGIGTSTKNREYYLSSYLSSTKNDNILLEDNILGNVFYSYLLGQFTQADDNFNSIENIVNPFTNGIFNLIKNTEFYSKLNKKNIFSMLFDANSDKKEINNFKLALKMESNILVESSSKIISKRTLYLSYETASYLLENKNKYKIKSTNLQEVVDEFLISLGEYNTHIVLTDKISPKKAFVSIEKSSILFNDLSKVNGDNDFSLYKNEYNKALLNINKFDSIMWNPHIFN